MVRQERVSDPPQQAHQGLPSGENGGSRSGPSAGEPELLKQEELLSIGDVASASGISVETIRMWERRYGHPRPIRLPSGHRRYTDHHVRWLRRVAEVLAQGHRPARVIRLEEEALDQLLRPASAERGDSARLQVLLDVIRNYDAEALRRELRSSLEALGPMAFLNRELAPLLAEVGRAWADAVLEIRHEHFLAAQMEDLLREMRRGLTVSPAAPLIVLATLPGETHGLGLQMAAVVVLLAGARPLILGTAMPLEEIARVVEETEAVAAALSVSLSSGGVETDRGLSSLRKMLPPRVRLVIGGQGARGVRRGPRGVDYCADLGGFGQWLAAKIIRGSGA